MLRRIGYALAVALGPWAAFASAEPPDFDAVRRASYLAELADSPDGMPPEPSDLEEAQGELKPMPQAAPRGAGEQYWNINPQSGSCQPGSCETGSCAIDDACSNDCCRHGLWGRMEALSWWMRGGQAPPLVSTGPVPTGTVLFPNEDFNRQARFGGRFTLGYWFDDCETEGLQGNFFILGRATTNYTGVTGLNGPTIGRPFTDVPTPPDGLPPNQFINLAPAGLISDAYINVRITSNIMGAEANYRKALWWGGDGSRVDMLAGYRFIRFDESLAVTTNQNFVQPSSTNSIFVSDQFSTQNQFHGGQIALDWQKQRGPWGLDIVGKLGIGGVHQRINVQGQTIITPQAGSPAVLTGGVLALPSNIGQYSRNVFSFLPEIDADLTYRLTDLWQLRVGYTLFFLTHVARPGNFIDTNLNSQQFPSVGGAPNNTPPPNFAFRDDYIWVQGINVGLECRF